MAMGLSDLIVGAGSAASNGAGRSYVVFGKSNTTAINLSDCGGGYRWLCPSWVRRRITSAADSVSAAGDVNGDGLS